MLATDTKCAGALITNNIVLTSDSCVNSTKHAAASIKFGVLIFNDTKSLKSFEIRQNDMMTQYHLTILKLPEELEINEFIAPAHMPNFVFDVLSGNILLAGWTGFKYECNQQLRKWFIPATKFWSCGDNLICLNQTDILNYREVIHFNVIYSIILIIFNQIDASCRHSTSNLSSVKQLSIYCCCNFQGNY